MLNFSVIWEVFVSRKYYRTDYRQNFYKEFVEKQEGCCAICKSEERLVIDHDHSNGYMRGLLCYKHNTGLGLFNDNPNLLEAAASYLRNNKPEPIAVKHTTHRKPSEKTKIARELAIELLNDPHYPSDRARARVLAISLDCSIHSAQSRISRARRKM